MSKDGKSKPAAEDITSMLNGSFDPASKDRLARLLYPELKKIARSRLQRERQGHTLQATALVSELYLHLLQKPDVKWTSRNHFLLAASQAMHRLLVDHARARKAQKRGGGINAMELEDSWIAGNGQDVLQVLEVDALLGRLAEREPRMASVVEMKFFGGLTFAEIGSVLGVDERTAKRDWTLARGWLRWQMGQHDSTGMGENQGTF